MDGPRNDIRIKAFSLHAINLRPIQSTIDGPLNTTRNNPDKENECQVEINEQRKKGKKYREEMIVCMWQK